MPPRSRLDPRRHFAAAIGWAVFGVLTLAALLTANLVASDAERRARADADARLSELAVQLRDAVSMQLEARRSLLQARAVQVAALATGDEALRQDLDAIREPFPEFDWIGVLDERGRVRQASGTGPGPGRDLSASAWYGAARTRMVVSDREALPGAGGADGMRALLFALPLDPRSPRAGVLAARLSWSWVERLLARMGAALDSRHRIDVLLATRDGIVIAGPPTWLGARLDAGRDPAEGGAYLSVSRSSLRLAEGVGLGWTAVVREPAGPALDAARRAGRTVFLTIFAGGLLAAGAAVAATRLLTRRLSRLSDEAEALRRGERDDLEPPAGADEVARIGATLAEVVGHLQREKAALQALNTELDARVAERTARIERMADESRHAAVTRERLRIARDLHDTLAHSLMALLTQVRLIRKLRARMDGDELDAELARAEEVAAGGLAGARSAIAQMRGNGVREAGLGPALEDLARRFGERTGVPVALHADPAAAAWADERSETVFRIVEEALRNVERHAGPRQVRLEVRREGERLHVEVADDGVGFDPRQPRPGHYGLIGIQEQAALIDAELGVHSRPGAGTRIALSLAV